MSTVPATNQEAGDTVTALDLPTRATWPAFIVGCHRSGTTLLRYFLDAHPRLSCPPESKFLAALPGIMTYPQAMRGLASLGVSSTRLLSDLRAMVDAYFREFAARRGKQRWIDKTPNYAGHLPFLDALFRSEALYLLVMRHPLDTAESMNTTPAFLVDEPEDPDIAASVRRYGHGREAWLHHWLDLADAMLWFHSRSQGRTHIVRYEDLVVTPEHTLRDVLRFLEEPAGPDTPRDMIATAFNRPHTPGYEDPKIRDSGGLHRESVGKWVRWPVAEVDRLWDIVGPTAERLGYRARIHGGQEYVVS